MPHQQRVTCLLLLLPYNLLVKILAVFYIRETIWWVHSLSIIDFDHFTSLYNYVKLSKSLSHPSLARWFLIFHACIVLLLHIFVEIPCLFVCFHLHMNMTIFPISITHEIWEKLNPHSKFWSKRFFYLKKKEEIGKAITWESWPLETRCRTEAAMAFSARLRATGSESWSHTSKPAWAATCAIPDPIWPLPTTPITFTAAVAMPGFSDDICEI